jgi:hypothetical protein
MQLTQETVASFLEAANNTNFEIVARGNSLNGAVAPVIKVYEQRTPSGGLKTEVFAQYSGHMDGGQQRSFATALNAAKGHDYVQACDLLTDSYFYQVEVRPLTSIKVADVLGDQPNPMANLEPLVWHAEPRMGRPSQGRERRIQSQITPELASWIEAQKQDESLSDVIFRLLDGLRQAENQKSL